MFSFIRKISSDTKSLPLGLKLLTLVVFLRTLGWGFIDPFFSLYVDSFGESYQSVGFLMAIMNFVALIAVLPLLRLADRVKDTSIVRDGEVLQLFSVLFYISAGLLGKISLLIPGLVLNGMGTSLIIVGAEAFIRRQGVRGAETRAYSFFTALHYLGWVTGMLIGAFTVQYYGLTYMFLFLLPSHILGLAILKHIHESGLKSLFSGFTKYFHRRQDFEVIIRDLKKLNPRTFFFLLLAFFDGVIVMFSYIFIPLFGLSINLDLKRIALLMATMYMPFIFSFIISEATDRLERRNVLAIGLFIGGLAFVLLSFIIHQTWVLLLAAMISLSLAIIRPTYNGILTQLTPRHMLGEITGLNKIAMRVGFIIGPIVTGFIADQYSIQASFFTIAIFAFVLAGIALLFRGYETLQKNA